MRKGTKTIRKVFTGTQEYYVYDLDEDALGKRKRLYAKTESELKEKIEQAEKERQLALATQRPLSTKLSDCAKYYFKNAVGKIAASDIKRYMTLFENTVYGSMIDTDINTLTAENIQTFLDKLSEVYHRRSVEEARNTLEKIFELYEMDVDFSTITVNDKAIPVSCIVTPAEYEEVIEYCLLDNCTKCGKNELILLFCLFTGISISKAKKLNRSDVDLIGKTFTVDKKTYLLPEKCAAWLQEQELSGMLNDSPLFINSNNVSPTLQSIQSTIDSITKRLGLPKGLTGKTLTKSYIVWQIDKGVTAEALTEYFGFKDKFKIQNIYDEYKVRTELFR